MKKSVWSTILKVIIAVATAIAGAFGLQAANCFSKPPHPFPLLKTTSPKRGHPLTRRTVFLKGPASPQRAGNGSPSGLSGRA